MELIPEISTRKTLPRPDSVNAPARHNTIQSGPG
jgi:hypothetical protein